MHKSWMEFSLHGHTSLAFGRDMESLTLAALDSASCCACCCSMYPCTCMEGQTRIDILI